LNALDLKQRIFCLMENIMPLWKASSHKSSDLQQHPSMTMKMQPELSGTAIPLLPVSRTLYKMIINQRSNLMNLLNIFMGPSWI